MSIYAGIVNPRKALSSTVTSSPALVGGTAMYVTIPWPSYSTVERLVISSNETFSGLTVTLLSNGAAYRAASTDDQQQYILDRLAQAGGAVQWYEFDVNSQTRDQYRAGYLYLLISGTFTTGATFRVTVDGYARIPAETEGLDSTPYKDDNNFRVLRLTSGDTKANDLTSVLAWNGPPTPNGDSPICFASTNDTLYFGSDKVFSALDLQIASGSQTTGQFAWQYFKADTGTWTSFAPIDNTSDGQSTPGEFNYSGTLALPTLAAWGPSQITQDPLKQMMDEILAGTRLPMGLAHNPARYWIRATPASLNGTLKLGFARTLNV